MPFGVPDAVPSAAGCERDQARTAARRRSILTGCAALACALFALLATASPGRAATGGWAPCKAAKTLSCTVIPVPLDREGFASGTIELQVGRLMTGSAQSQSAVLALAGGPGQAALPVAEGLAESIGPGLQGRDLLVYDQRGTGESDPINCKALSSSSSDSLTPGEVLARCADQLGPARGAFTTQESVQDIETIRETLGYQKLVLYGTSYGTRVALQYAEEYPQYVEALVLDSVVPPGGPEPFAVSSFQAVGRVLSEDCSDHDCHGITSHPVSDMGRLAGQLAHKPLTGTVFSGTGKRRRASLNASELFEILEAGDLNPALRALLPAAVVSALHGDPDPVLRLSELAQGLTPNVPLHPNPKEENAVEDNTLFYATSCEERAFPWERTASPSVRMQQAEAALGAIPASDFAPFDPAVSFEESLVPECVDWPDEAPATPAGRALPDVPTLLLSGAQDLRTPTANAQSVAARIPGAEVLVVPYTGHSVLGSDLTPCASEAVTAFFGGQPIKKCEKSQNYFTPTTVSPTSLSRVKPAPGVRGRPGRTLTAVLETVVDLERQIIGATLQAETNLPKGSSFGGLRGGFAKLEASSVRLSHLAFIPGVQLTGTLHVVHEMLETKSIRISGAAAATGTVKLKGSTMSGRLGGKRFRLDFAGTAGASRRGRDPFRASGLAGLQTVPQALSFASGRNSWP